ncbi:MFS transporter [Actinoplanes siamensis]|uniref:Uncharacterized protein n=1 Tax=Actinoplanes siamensis TaxID=1223317 RepID=A0A919N476_9ACTN|nr:hypothetical protein [Actinoplanes siamensis]GIF04080.1 hypothetical protein Asi03nite_16180 [Actinoplanes siamensis]
MVGTCYRRARATEILIGPGLGRAITPAANAATSGVGDDNTGAESAAVDAATQPGGCIGTAPLNTVASPVTAAAPGSAHGRNATGDATVAPLSTPPW